jgi:hypothetical protein
VLSRHGKKVFSIEPEPALFAAAKKLFKCVEHVAILQGLSETVLPALLPTLDGDVNFWLDGHYSAGITFQGPSDTPILDELACIGRNLGRFRRIVVLVDDVRCFVDRQGQYSGYPSLDSLVDWARANELSWHIEHDIFIAGNVSR